MKVEYITHSGDDLLVVNAARVSLDKHHEEFQDNDERLINYLATHGHWTPFSHPQITLRLSVPIFVANQLKRHTIGLTINEVSRRYVDSEPEFYIPDKLGARAQNKKQGAKEGEFIDSIEFGFNSSLGPSSATAKTYLQLVFNKCLENYETLLQQNVAQEDARIVLPLATYTSWYWTGSLYAYARLCNLRLKKDTQRQTREVAQMINDIIEPLFPYSWKALVVIPEDTE